jgi:L-arabinonolactonase
MAAHSKPANGTHSHGGDFLESIVYADNQLGECVLWCERTGRVLWTDILGSTLFAHDLDSGRTAIWKMPERLASFALTQDEDRLLLGLASRLAFFSFSSGEVTSIVEVEPELDTRLNDGRCDREGNFVFGTFHEGQPKAPLGSFYRLRAADLRLERLPLQRAAIANSICFSPDGSVMYYCDSVEGVIRCCDYPVMTNPRIFAEVEGGGDADGSCIDAEGYLWNAQWGASRVTRYAPDGRIDRTVTTAATQPSCVTFGGPGLDVLLCSSATVGLPAPTKDDGALLAGRIAGVKGLPETRFAVSGEASRRP